MEKGLNASLASGKDAQVEEGELVVSNPKLASLIYHSFNIALLLVVILFIVHIVVYYNASEAWWQALVGTAIVSPLFIIPIYCTPGLRDFIIKEFAMGNSYTRGI